MSLPSKSGQSIVLPAIVEVHLEGSGVVPRSPLHFLSLVLMMKRQPFNAVRLRRRIAKVSSVSPIEPAQSSAQ